MGGSPGNISFGPSPRDIGLASSEYQSMLRIRFEDALPIGNCVCSRFHVKIKRVRRREGEAYKPGPLPAILVPIMLKFGN